MGLMRGVQSLHITRVETSDEMVQSVELVLQNLHSLVSGDKVVITLGLPLWKTGTTNTMKVIKY
jgi:pyruvate kinase